MAELTELRWSRGMVVGLLLFALSACGGSGEEAENSASSPREPTTSPASEDADVLGGQSSSGEPGSVPEPADAVALATAESSGDVLGFVPLRPVDFPDGAVGAELAEISPPSAVADPYSQRAALCDGVGRVAVEEPILWRSVDIEDTGYLVGGHTFGVEVIAYQSSAEAVHALDYLDEAFTQCNERFVDRSSETPTFITTWPVVTDPPEGIDRIVGHTALFTRLMNSSVIDHRMGVVGSRLFIVYSSDLSTTDDATAVVASRLRGIETVGDIKPSGPLELLPGPGRPEFWNGRSDGPTQMRGSSSGSTAAKRWISEATDERLDEVAGLSCAVTAQRAFGYGRRGPLPEATEVVRDVFSYYDREAFSDEELYSVSGVAIDEYCPDYSITG